MYTYAFLQAPELTLQLPNGIEGRLELVRQAGMAALTEPDLEFGQVRQNDARLLQAAVVHDRVMCAVFAQVPLLPLQFGTVFQSRQKLLGHLQQHQQRYLDKLERLANCVEYCCKLTPRQLQPAERIEENNGDRSDAESAAVGSEAQFCQREVEKQSILAQIARNYPRLVAQRQGKIERAYVLVQRGQVWELEEQVIRWRSQLRNWQLELGEPLPPYHFV